MADEQGGSAVTGGEDGAGGSAAALLLGAGADGGGGDQGGGDKPAGDAPGWWSDLPADKPEDGKLSDQEWAKTKGYADIAAMVKAHRALETTIGGEKVPVPKSADDKDGWDRLFKAAGRPDAPEGYGLDTVEGVDPELAKGFAAEAHKHGLNPAQATAMVNFQLGLVAQAQAAIAERDRSEAGELAASLGAKAGAEIERVIRAGKATGLNDDQLGKMREAIGPKAMFKMLGALARAVAEDTLEGGGQGGGSKTLEQLAARKQEIQRDPALRKRLNDGDPALKAEWEAIAVAQAAARERAKAA